MLLSKIQTFGGSSGERIVSKAESLYTVQMPFWPTPFYLFYDGENSPWWYLYLLGHVARNEEPSPHPLVFKLLTPSTSQTALRSCLHFPSSCLMPEQSLSSHCSIAVVFLLASFASTVLILSGKNCQLPYISIFSPLLYFPACLAGGCDHVAKFWPMVGSFWGSS